MEALQIGSDSLAVTLDAGGATGEAWTIPDNSAGRKPRFIYLATDGDVSFLLATNASGTPTSPSGKVAGTIAITNASVVRSSQPVVVTTGGFDRILTISFDGTGSEVLVITPLEN